MAEVGRAFLDIARRPKQNDCPMRLLVKLCLAIVCASAAAFGAHCGNFSATDTNSGSGSGTDGGPGTADGAAPGVEGGPSEDASSQTGEGGSSDGGVDAGPSCATRICDEAGALTPYDCPDAAALVVYEFYGNCTNNGGVECQYCYSTDPTASANNCASFSANAAIPKFSVYNAITTAPNGLLELDSCGQSTHYRIQRGGVCTNLGTGLTKKETVLGYVVPGKSCGSKDLTEMYPDLSSDYYYALDASPPNGNYTPTGITYQAWPPP